MKKLISMILILAILVGGLFKTFLHAEQDSNLNVETLEESEEVIEDKEDLPEVIEDEILIEHLEDQEEPIEEIISEEETSIEKDTGVEGTQEVVEETIEEVTLEEEENTLEGVFETSEEDFKETEVKENQEENFNDYLEELRGFYEEEFLREKSYHLSEEEIKSILNGTYTYFDKAYMDRSIGGNSEALMNNFEVSSTYDGTSPFDEDDASGNDSNNQNKIVRSFDKIVYRTSYSTISKDEFDTSTRGVLYFKAFLPLPKSIASWDTTAMNFLEDMSIEEKDGGSYLSGKLSVENQILSPRVGSINWVISVNQALDKTSIPSPTFYMKASDEDYMSCRGDDISVSASTNINGHINFDSYYLKPKFALVLELVANKKGKGIKGLQIPDTSKDISLDIEFDSNLKVASLKNNTSLALGPYDDNGQNLKTTFNKVYKGGSITYIQEGKILKATIKDYAFDYLRNRVSHNLSKTSENLGQDYDDDRFPFASFALELEGVDTSKKINRVSIKDLRARQISGQEIKDFYEEDNHAEYTTYKPEGGGPGRAGGPVQVLSVSVINPTNGNKFSLIDKDASRNLPPDYKVYVGDIVRVYASNMMYKSSYRDYIKTYYSLLKFDTNIFRALKSSEEYSDYIGNNNLTTRNFYWVTKSNKKGWENEKEMFEAHIEDIRNKNGYVLFENVDDALKQGYEIVAFLARSDFNNPTYEISFDGFGTYPGLKVKSDALIDSTTKKSYKNQDPARVGLILGELEAIDYSNKSYKRLNVYGQLGDDLDMYQDHENIKLGFIKAKYDENLNLVSPSASNAIGNRNGNYTKAASLVGASFYVLPINTYINKRVLQKINDTDDKEVFNLDLGQYQVDIQLDGGTSAHEKLDVTGDIEVIEEIPSTLKPYKNSSDIIEKWGISYGGNAIQDSSFNGKAGIILENSSKNILDVDPLKNLNKNVKLEVSESVKDGKTYLRWYFKDYPLSFSLPKINYRVLISDDIKESLDIETLSKIKSSVTSDENIRKLGIRATRIGGAVLEKVALDRSKGDLGFKIDFKNTSLLGEDSILNDLILVDILPYNNSFNKNLDLKNYKLDSLKVTSDIYSFKEKPTLTLYYSTHDPSILDDASKFLLNNKTLYKFDESYWQKLDISLSETNNKFSFNEDIINKIQDKKITGLGIRMTDIAHKSTLSLEYKYGWDKKEDLTFHLENTSLYNRVKMAAGSPIYQETFTSATSSPGLIKDIASINNLEKTHFNHLNNKPVQAKDIIEYEIDVTDPSIVRIIDKIPDGVRLIEDSISDKGIYNREANEIEWNIDKPSMLKFKVEVLEDDIDVIINQALGKNMKNEVIYSNKVNNPKVRISALKTSNIPEKTYVKNKDVIEYTIRVKNESIHEVNDVRVTDIIPTYTSFKEIINFKKASFDKDRVNFVIEKMQPNEVVDLKFSVVVNTNEANTIINRASYGIKNPDKKTNEVIHYIKVDQEVYKVVETSDKSLLVKNLVILSGFTILLFMHKRRG